jgi:hypothetical protein
MTSQKISFWKNNMNFGAITGFAIIIVTVLLYFLNISQNFAVSVIVYVIQIAAIVIGTRYLRDKILNGNITYGKALSSGTMISIFAAIIIAFYMFIFLKFIDPGELDKIFSLMEDNLYKQGLPEDQIEMALDMSRKFTTPFTIAIGTVFSYGLWGFFFSLITSAFIRKKSNSYDAAMSEIEKEINEENK